ncbi:hypothetical protein Tco_0060002 [Tanacetum coccineum]
MFYEKNVDYATLICEDIQFQIDSRLTSAKRREQMAYPRFTKGEEHQKYGMSIPDSMMNDAIRSTDSHLTYLALSTNIEATVPKEVKGKGKVGKGKKKAATSIHKEKKKDAVKKNETLTKAKIKVEESRLHEAHAHLVTIKVADTTESDETEDDEIQPLIRRPTGVVIGREIPKEIIEEALDHSMKNKDSSEGSGVNPEVPNESRDDSAAQADQEKADENKAKEGKATEEQAGEEPPVDEQAGREQAKVHVLEPAVPNPSSSLALSSAEYGNQFINENPKVSINDVLKDTTDVEIHLLVDVHIHQEDPAIQ